MHVRKKREKCLRLIWIPEIRLDAATVFLQGDPNKPNVGQRECLWGTRQRLKVVSCVLAGSGLDGAERYGETPA